MIVLVWLLVHGSVVVAGDGSVVVGVLLVVVSLFCPKQIVHAATVVVAGGDGNYCSWWRGVVVGKQIKSNNPETKNKNKKDNTNNNANPPTKTAKKNTHTKQEP